MKNSSLILLLLFFYSCNESNNQFIEKQTWEIINNGADSILAEKIIYDNEYIKHYIFNGKISDTNEYIIKKNNLIVKTANFSNGKPYHIQELSYNLTNDLYKIKNIIKTNEFDSIFEGFVINSYKNGKIFTQDFSKTYYNGIQKIEHNYFEDKTTISILKRNKLIFQVFDLQNKLIEERFHYDTIYYDYNQNGKLKSIKSKIKSISFFYKNDNLIQQVEYYILKNDTVNSTKIDYIYNELDSISKIIINGVKEYNNYYFIKEK